MMKIVEWYLAGYFGATFPQKQHPAISLDTEGCSILKVKPYETYSFKAPAM